MVNGIHKDTTQHKKQLRYDQMTAKLSGKEMRFAMYSGNKWFLKKRSVMKNIAKWSNSL